MTEIDRIREAYHRRDVSGKEAIYSPFNGSSLFLLQIREQMLLRSLRANGYNSDVLRTKKILDVGCGDGRTLRRFVDYGAVPSNLFGIDLLQRRIELAQRLNPGISFVCGNAECLLYEHGFFDIVIQFTVFTSILDRAMKVNVAWEMLRVLKPDGIILWYDFHINNPRNPDVRGVGRREIHRLFPGCSIALRRITLAPPLARRLVPRLWLLAYVLEKIPWLCTHYLGVIRKRSEVG